MTSFPKPEYYAKLGKTIDLMEAIHRLGLRSIDVKNVVGATDAGLIHRWSKGISRASSDNLGRLELVLELATVAIAAGVEGRQLASFFAIPQSRLHDLSPSLYIQQYPEVDRGLFAVLLQGIRDGEVELPMRSNFDPSVEAPSKAAIAMQAELLSEKFAAQADVLMQSGFVCSEIGRILADEKLAGKLLRHESVSLTTKQRLQLEAAATAASRLAAKFGRNSPDVRELLLSSHSQNGLGGISIIQLITALPDPTNKLGQRRVAVRIDLVNRAVGTLLDRRTPLRA